MWGAEKGKGEKEKKKGKREIFTIISV